MELSEARTPSPATGRRGDRPVEAHTLAPYKNAARRGAHLVFLDESGFLLIPNVVHT